MPENNEFDINKVVSDVANHNIDKLLGVATNVFLRIDKSFKIKFKTAYKEYLKSTSQKYSQSKSFFIRNEPVDLYKYYVSIGIANKIEISIPTFNKCIEVSNRIVIKGTGGSGKSVLVKHLFLDCIKSKNYTPILVELRDLNNETFTLDTYIAETLETYSFKQSEDFIEQAKKEGHFCFFLDGYDEVEHSRRKKLVKEIKQLSKKYSQCPIIVSTRPDDSFDGLNEFSIFSILPLALDVASQLIEKLPFDEAIKKKFITDLKDGLFEKHKSFLSNPLLLSIMLITYGEYAEIPTKISVFYSRAYEALFRRHDAYKEGYARPKLTTLDTLEFSKIFSLFSLQTYDKSIFKTSRINCLELLEKSKANIETDFKTEDYLEDLLTATCMLSEDGLDIAFSHRSFQEYFVALYISKAVPKVQEQLINKYWKNMSTDSVVLILFEINPELVERLLIIPKLDTLFNSLKIKRKIGITHAARVFKSRYDNLNIVGNKIYASGHYTNEIDVMHFCVQYCGNYVFREPKYYKNRAKNILKKYGEGKDEIRFPSKKLTIRTPCFKDILQGYGSFSIYYIQEAYDVYKKLKKKHNNPMNDINKLLGI